MTDITIQPETRYSVEYRRPGDPWQEAEPHLDWHERYPETREDAEEAAGTLKFDGRVPSAYYRIVEVAVAPPVRWLDLPGDRSQWYAERDDGELRPPYDGALDYVTDGRRYGILYVDGRVDWLGRSAVAAFGEGAEGARAGGEV